MVAVEQVKQLSIFGLMCQRENSCSWLEVWTQWATFGAINNLTSSYSKHTTRSLLIYFCISVLGWIPFLAKAVCWISTDWGFYTLLSSLVSSTCRLPFVFTFIEYLICQRQSVMVATPSLMEYLKMETLVQFWLSTYCILGAGNWKPCSCESSFIGAAHIQNYVDSEQQK